MPVTLSRDRGGHRAAREHVGAGVVEAEESLDRQAFRRRIGITPGDVLDDALTRDQRPIRRKALVVAVTRRLGAHQQIGAHVCRVDIQPRLERRLEEDRRVVGVDQRGAADADAQAALRRTAVDAVIRIGRIVHEFAPLLEPRVHRVPGNVNETGGLRLGLIRQVADVVGREDVAQRSAPPVHHQRPLCVDHQPPVLDRLHAPGMRLDVHNPFWPVGYRGREAPRRIAAERSPPGHQSHAFLPVATTHLAPA